MWKKLLGWFAGTGLLWWFFRFLYGLAEDALHGWINDFIAQRWQMLISYFLEWGIPVLFAGLGAWLLIWLGMSLGRTKPTQIKAEQKQDRLTPLSNRDELFRAISEVQQVSADLLMAQEQLDNLEARSPNLVHVDAMITRDNAYDNYKQAMNKLNAEKLVAGKPFESLLSELTGYISTHVMVKTVKPPIVGGTPRQSRILTALECVGRIASKISEVTQKIEEISG